MQIVLAHLYGTPGKMDEIRAIADKHGALIVEDAAESLGAKYFSKASDRWIETGALGDYNCISFIVNRKGTGRLLQKEIKYGRYYCQKIQKSRLGIVN